LSDIIKIIGKEEIIKLKGGSTKLYKKYLDKLEELGVSSTLRVKREDGYLIFYVKLKKKL
tara:strand:+ start:173 stop:352 length:180 start_codon:yes stop_codon:yes gene_type:complete